MVHHVLGSLGEGSFAPLYAEAVFPDGYRRRVVLHRPAPVAAYGLATIRSPYIQVEEGRVRTPRGLYAVSGFVPGLDSDMLVSQLGSGSGYPRAIRDLAMGVVAALREASGVGVPHGALRASTIRTTPSGQVVVLGFRGGGEDDLAALWDLVSTWLEVVGGPRPGEVPSTWEEAEARLMAWEVSGPSLSELNFPGEPVLVDHPLRGAEWTEGAAAAAAPPKVRVAGAAALTLILGLMIGLLLAGGGP